MISLTKTLLFILIFSTALISVIPAYAEESINLIQIIGSETRHSIPLIEKNKDATTQSYSNRAQLSLNAGDYRTAYLLMIKAIEIDKDIYGDIHKKTAADFNLLATTLSFLDQYEKAKIFFLKSQEIRMQLYAADSPILTHNLFGLAVIKKAQSQFHQSLLNHISILTTRDKTEDNIAILQSLLEISELEIILANYQVAQNLLIRAKNIIDKNFFLKHAIYAEYQSKINFLLIAEGDYISSKKFYKRLLEKHTKSLGRKNVLVANSLVNIAKIMNLDNKSVLALPLLKESLAIFNTKFGSGSMKSAITLSYLAYAALKTGNFDDAKNYNLKSNNILKIQFPDGKHPIAALNLEILAHYEINQQKYESAHHFYLDAQIILESIYHSNHPEVANIIASRADLFFEQKKYREAKQYYTKAINILSSHFPVDHPLLKRVLDKYNYYVIQIKKKPPVFSSNFITTHPEK